MGRKRAMSLIRVYLLAKTFVFRNEHFQLVFKLKTILLKIRARNSLGLVDFGEINPTFFKINPSKIMLLLKRVDFGASVDILPYFTSSVL
jgi:hypothetical protein